MKEWKEIEFTEGRYSCSSDGEIRNNKTGRLLAGTLTPDGYRSLGMMMPNGKQKSFLWHRVVAAVWHPNPDNYGHVDHFDSNRLNNHPSNLSWMTVTDNVDKAHNFKRETVILISPDGIEVPVTVAYSFAKEHGLSCDGVRNVIRGIQTSHKGWELKRDQQ